MKHTEWTKIHTYCMEKPGAYESRPFGESPICYRLCGRIFAQLSPEAEWFKITLKTNPEAADFYRQAYPGIVVRGYHCPSVQQPYWNTIELARFELETLYQMIDEAYDEIIKKMTGKQRQKIPFLSSLQFVKTDGNSEDFARLCECLDQNLDEIVGGRFNRQKYTKYNQLDDIHDVITVYLDGQAIAGGSYRFYDEETVEIKRMYVDGQYRRRGISRELLLRLEADARIAGYRFAVLETGELLEAAMELYRKAGYKRIPNYGQYADMPESICMMKKL